MHLLKALLLYRLKILMKFYREKSRKISPINKYKMLIQQRSLQIITRAELYFYFWIIKNSNSHTISCWAGRAYILQ
jgi:hypothetical protein